MIDHGVPAVGVVEYVRTMRKLYRDRIEDFNTTYGMKFESFEALAAAADWRPRTELSNASETRDNIAFLHAVVDQYYRTAKEAIQRHDSNHLFVGDKLNGNTDALDTVLPVASRYTDVVLYQMYGRYEVQQPGLDPWSKLAGKPFINGDSAFTMVTDTMPRPFGPVAANLARISHSAGRFAATGPPRRAASAPGRNRVPGSIFFASPFDRIPKTGT